MAKVVKSFQVLKMDDGSTCIISPDKRQMARWFALDYLKDKPQLNSQGYYVAVLSSSYRFVPTFRRI
ncbi:hypothetical protein [Pediococcus acidilactici]|uniref:hypothetical protein n=1 Tax=Pediococcus acidilactici TaxID=1254 RepID=UPI00137C19AF|nr:hypothetical protein [Pediococcus acidilactici]QHS02488.1 hypothetical protein GWA24_01470 [Pediococcus acidilactici]